MSKTKKSVVVLLLFVMFAFTIIATHRISIHHHRYFGRFREGVIRVRSVPWNFVSIENLEEITNGTLRFQFGIHCVGFKDSDNVRIYSTLSGESDIIVRYRDEFFVNEHLIESLMIPATIIAEQRNRVHNLGDVVMLRGRVDIPYVIIIVSVETEIINDVSVNTIRFKTDRYICQTRVENIFDHIETDRGTVIDDLTVIDEQTVEVILPADEKIHLILLTSPDFYVCLYWFQGDCNSQLRNGCCIIRMVGVSDIGD